MFGEGDELNDGQIVLNTPDRDRDPPPSALTQLRNRRHEPGVDGNATGEGNGPVAVSTVIISIISLMPLFFIPCIINAQHVRLPCKIIVYFSTYSK